MDLSIIFGSLGVVTNALWPLIKRRTLLLSGQIFACFFMCMHFLFMEAYTGAAVMAVAGIQAALAIPLESHPKFKCVYFLSLTLTPALCWFTWQGLPSIFSSLALIFFCIGNFQINIWPLRLFLLLCLFSWIGHHILIHSYPALISNILALCTSIYGILRELKLNKSELPAANHSKKV